MTTMDRRKFLLTATAATSTLLGSRLSLAAEPLDESEPIAVSLGYHANANDVDVAKFPKRAGAEGAKQFCSNCALYQPVAGGYGTCTAIPGKLVAGAGWCNVWVPKT